MYVFIGGTPASGKSYTARDFIKNSKLKIKYVSIDELRSNFYKDPKLEYWVNFFWNKDELKYWKNIKFEDHLQNMISQPEAFWPGIMEKVKLVKRKYENAIFEGVNLLPHLVIKDLDFQGFFLIQEDINIMLERLKVEPRWGDTQKLQQLEAKLELRHMFGI